MSRIAYVNGRYLPQRDASVNIEDRGYQFADGVYEVVVLHHGRLIDEDLHLDRLQRSLNEIEILAPMGRASLRHVLYEVARRNRVRDGVLYMQITRGVARREHAFPTHDVPPALVVTIRRMPAFPRSVEAWTTRAITRADERWARCDIKSTGLLANVLARQAARTQGAGEAVLVDAAGMVTEGAATSVWIVDAQGVLRTRHLDAAILPGCTRAALLDLVGEAGMTVDTRAFSVTELRAAQEAFITSASSFVKPVTHIDGQPIGDGTVGLVTRRLFAMFARHVTGGLPNAA
jgi:D-alanine transaminase